jgi:hypothetical protein
MRARMRRMALRAVRVLGHRVQSGQLVAYVTGRTGRRRGGTARPMRPVACLARPLYGLVRAFHLVRVARAAGGLRTPCARVRIMASEALLMSRWSAYLLLGVARSARGRCYGRVSRGAMARRAGRVSLAGCGQLGFARVARRAEGLSVGRREIVRFVAADAGDSARVRGRIGRSDGSMTAGACVRDRADVTAVRLVAIDACRLAVVLQRDIGVTPAARVRGLGGCVRRVAARTRRVRGDLHGDLHGAQRRLDAVATHAGDGTAGDEVVRFVAADARVVAGGFWPGRICVAGRAD